MVRARRRALRAARAVTMGLGLGGAGLACSGSPGLSPGDGATPRDLAWNVADVAKPADLSVPEDLAVPPDVAATVDLAKARDFAAATDLAVRFDAKGDFAGFDGVCPQDGGMAGSDPDCCVASGGFWINGGCAIPGPFVPPSLPA
jgi:hypothetical protein